MTDPIKEGSKVLEDYYDYIITGAGCAGLSLVMHIIADGKPGDKKILLLDQDAKTSNDRTWCFWEKEDGLFQSIIYKEWKDLQFKSVDYSKQLIIAPYTYKLIRGIDFYHYCFEQIKQHPNICFKQSKVENIISDEKATYVVVNGQKIKCQYVFNSIFFSKPNMGRRHYWLLQHFKGWFIETEEQTFNPLSATLMDFNAHQNKGTAFYYVLPFSTTKALIEYTLFSPNLLTDVEYETALKNYIEQQLNIASYAIYEKESGSIPMTNYPFSKFDNRIINIGTAGGQTKGSTGYSFQFIQKHSAGIARKLAEGKYPLSLSSNSRFYFYDSILLYILNHNKIEGREIFKRLFNKNKASSVLKFLDNETSLREELAIINSLPTMPFLKAAIKQTTGFL